MLPYPTPGGSNKTSATPAGIIAACLPDIGELWTRPDGHASAPKRRNVPDMRMSAGLLTASAWGQIDISAGIPAERTLRA
jgi:hypothetical protein